MADGSTTGNGGSRGSTAASGRTIDLASFTGFLVAPGCILLGLWLEGDNLRNLLQLSAMFIVFGSTIAACLVSFSPFYLLAAVQDLGKIFSESNPHQFDLIDRLVQYATEYKTKGAVALDEMIKSETYPTLAKGLKLVANNTDDESMSAAIERMIHDRAEHNNAGAEVFEAAGGYLPTFGILGAVLGLIHTMSMLSDPSKIGGGIATAFVATVYGVGLANLVAYPVARKIRARARSEKQLDKIVVTGIKALRDGMNAVALRQLLSEGLTPVSHTSPTDSAEAAESGKSVA